MHEIKAIIRPERLDSVLDALHQIAELPGITVSTVTGVGRRQPAAASGAADYGQVAMTKLELVVPDAMLSAALASIRRAAFTGRPGDGKVFVIRLNKRRKFAPTSRGSMPSNKTT